ncbi:MAG: T9SS type A sorting domain-containing protein [Saprospiraceae bacterium]|nr:T9SS type A sorting domain-containing protein [Saprospiraceae bacterium]
MEFFPNPTEGQVTIRKSNVDLIIQDIKVVNTLNGLSHFETSGFTAKENEIKLYLDDIPAGAYYIQLQTNKGQMTKKIVKMQ